jgi:diaminopimelate epimerase
MKHPRIQFTKMHGIGNDFVVIDAINQTVNLNEVPIAQLGNRNTGIGFDQLLVIEPSTKADFFCRIFNSDGSEAEQCGNGLRCVARFLHENKLINTTSFALETKAGIFPVNITDYDHVCVTMGVPTIKEPLVDIQIDVIPDKTAISVLSVGNPHAILKVAGLQQVNAALLGKAISSHSYFPQGANVGFMEIINKDHIHLRTVERGAGETLACGSNACAAAIAGIKNGWLAPKVQVEFSQGSVWVEWQGDGRPVYLTGPAQTVFTGIL